MKILSSFLNHSWPLSCPSPAQHHTYRPPRFQWLQSCMAQPVTYQVTLGLGTPGWRCHGLHYSSRWDFLSKQVLWCTLFLMQIGHYLHLHFSFWVNSYCRSCHQYRLASVCISCVQLRKQALELSTADRQTPAMLSDLMILPQSWNHMLASCCHSATCHSLVDEVWYWLTTVFNFHVFNRPKKKLNSTQIILGF